jgi:hypothetical protein
MVLEGSTDDNVFEKNPGIEFLKISEDLIRIYGKNKASKVFWSLYMVYHPESKIFNSKIDDKIEGIGKNYLKLSEEEYQKIFALHGKNFIQEFVNDPIAKMLTLVKIKLDEYFNEVAFLDFRVDIADANVKQLNNIKDLSGYQDALDKYEMNLKKYIEKKDTGTLYGNITESLRELRYRIGRKK